MHSFVNIKTILGTSPDSYIRLVGSDLGYNCLQWLLVQSFCVMFRTNYSVKLCARVIAPAGKVKTTNLFGHNKEIMSPGHRDSWKCLSE